jgi:hypothetical protein
MRSRGAEGFTAEELGVEPLDSTIAAAAAAAHVETKAEEQEER